MPAPSFSRPSWTSRARPSAPPRSASRATSSTAAACAIPSSAICDVATGFSSSASTTSCTWSSSTAFARPMRQWPAMPERPAPLVLVTTPPGGQPFGSHAAIAADGQRLLATDLSRRLGRLGAAVAPLPASAVEPGARFHWGRWFTEAARAALDGASGPVDAIGYAGGSALSLVGDDALDALLSPIAGEVVANNRFSADAFVVAGDLAAALAALARCDTDNAAPRALNDAGFAWRDLGATSWSRFDVDTT